MSNWLAEEMRSYTGMQEICDAALGMSLKLTSASFGNLQVTDQISGFLKFQSQRGFRESFLKAFETVHPAGGSVCARALRNSLPTLVEDVMLDRAFAPYRGIAEEAGFRAVSSTPIISPGGMVLGVLSQHFPRPHKLTGAEAKKLELLARLTAEAIIRARRNREPVLDPALMQLRERIKRLNVLADRSRELIRTSRLILKPAHKLLDS